MKGDGIMRDFCRVVLVSIGVIAWSAAVADDFDGSKPLTCATVDAIECTVGLPCFQDVPEAMGAPRFMRIDFARKVVVGPKRTSPIVSMEKTTTQVLLQGTELGFAWSIALDRESGRLIATIADRAGAFMLFGTCTDM